MQRAKPASGEQKATEARLIRSKKIYDRATEYGDPECAPRTFGLVSDEIDVEEANDWITLSILDPEQPDEEGERFTLKYSQIVGYAVVRDKENEPFFTIMFKDAPKIILNIWNMDEAANVHNKFHEIMQGVAWRERSE